MREAKASLFVDTLVLEGFSRAGEQTATLYCVGKNEKESAPVQIKVQPTTPPYLLAFPTLTVNETFGGVFGSYTNPERSELKVTLMADTIGDGRYVLLRSFVSDLEKFRFNYLGLPSRTSNFAAFITDRWGNSSDTVYFNWLTPLRESFIAKDTWENYSDRLPSDETRIYGGNNNDLMAPYRMWDGTNEKQWYLTGSVGNAIEGQFPCTFTIKLNQTVTLSRLVLYAPGAWGSGGFQHQSPRLFEVWGSNKDVPGDDLFGGDWTLLGDFEALPPSGKMPPGTDEDIRTSIYDGVNYFFEVTDKIENPYVPIKYIRYRFKESFIAIAGDPPLILIGEMDLYGNVF
jgi:hypothetical protein